MNRSEWIFLVILIINTIIAIIYMLWAILFRNKNEEGENRRYSHIIRAVCIFLCPVVGLLFFLTGMLLRTVFFRSPVDLEDVVFSKERVRSHTKADEEREKNIVPIQEALAVTDYTQMRRLMLNVIKGDIARSLSSIALALDSEDSETSHYAASVLSKALNEFRVTVRKIDQEIHNEENERQQRDDYCVLLIDYMNEVLKQKVFTDVEQKYFVEMLADTGEIVYQDQLEDRKAAEEAAARIREERLRMEAQESKIKNQGLIKVKREQKETLQTGESVVPKTWMLPKHYSLIAIRLTEIGDYESADGWCTRAMEEYPKELESYRCRMEFLFSQEKKEEFMEVLADLKKSGIAIDSDTLEMIRVFQ